MNWRRKLRVLHEDHDSQLRARLRSLIHDPDMLNDVVQETWLRAMKHGALVSMNGHFFPWMVRVGRNLAITEYRRILPMDEVPELMDTRHSVSTTYLIHTEFVSTLRALSHLPTDVQCSVLLTMYCDYPITEVARIQQCSCSTVRARLSRARTYLRERACIDGSLGTLIIPNEYRPIGLAQTRVVPNAYHAWTQARDYTRWACMDSCVTHWTVEEQ